MKQKILFKIALAAIMLVCTMQAHAMSNIGGGMIAIMGSDNGTLSTDMTCTMFDIMDNSTLTINQGVTVTLNNPGRNFCFMDNSKIELHGTLTGSAGSDATWMDRSYINVYLSDGAKYTVTGLTCMEGDNYLVYYGYDAATDGNGTVNVKNGSTDVTSASKGYKTTTYTFTATPASGYKFVNWTKGAGGDVLGTDASINVTCEQNGQYQVYANFEADATAATLFDLTLADGSDAHGTVAFTVDGAAATQAKKDDVVTVSVTPAEGYSTKDVTVRAYTSWAAGARAMTRAAAPGLVDNIDVTPGENGTWTFTMPEANVWVVVTYTKNLQDTWIEAISDQTYTGSAIEPTVVVKDGETTLTVGTDYTVAYADNTDAGTATVTITAVAGSDYSGTASKTFTIAKVDITMTTAPAAVSGLVYSGEAQTLITAGTASFGTVLYSLDGTTYDEALPQATEVGTYTVYYKVEGDANHNAFAAQTVSVTIATKYNLTLADGDAITALSGYAGQTVNVTYTRSFTSGKPSTVCLPFAYTPQGEEKFYTFTGITESGGNYTANMTEVVSPLVANTPYLFMPTGNADFSGTYAIPASITAGKTTNGDWAFKGTYSTIEWSAAPSTPTYGFSAQAANDGITQGQFVKVGSYVRIKPMRAYLEYNGSDSQFAAARLMAPTRGAADDDETLPETIGVRLIGADGQVTAIGTMQTRTGEMTQDGWYTLDGKRLTGQPTQKGIYVNNCKKVIIK